VVPLMDRFILWLISLEYKEIALVIWSGKIYEVFKGGLALFIIMLVLWVLTPMGRSQLRRLIEPTDTNESLLRVFGQWVLGISFVILFLLKSAQYLSLQGVGDYASLLSTIWNVGRDGFMPNPVLGYPYLGQHFQPILLIYTPLAKIFNSPFIVVFLHSVLVLLSVPILWKLSEPLELPTFIRLLLCGMLLSNPYFQDSLSTWIYYESLAFTLFLLTLKYWDKGNYGWFLLSAVFLMGTKEEAGWALFSLGIASLFILKYRRAGIILSVFSLMGLFGTVLYMKGFHGSINFSRWKMFGWSEIPGGTFDFIISHPWQVFAQWAWPPQRFIPIAKMILWGGAFILAFPPAIVGLIIANVPHQMIRDTTYGFHTLKYIYAVFMLPLMFWGLVHGLKKLWKRYQKFHYLIVCVMLICIASGLLHSDNYVLYYQNPSRRIQAAWSLISLIPEDASVWTHQAFSPQLSFRDKIKVIQGFGGPVLMNKYFIPDYVLMIENQLSEEALVRASRFLKLYQFRILRREFGISLWRRPIPE